MGRLLVALLSLGAVYSQRANVEVVEVDEETQLDEFFKGVEEDAMMLQVISDMNGLEAFLESRNVSRSAGGELVDDGSLDERTLAAEESLNGLKRFSEFKQLVSWLQTIDKRITRYCFYGCWCLPEGAHSFVAGQGQAVDLVDRSCQQMWFCYTCAMAEFKYTFPSGVTKYCNPTSRRYTFKFLWNRLRPKDYSKRNIKCKDKWILPPYASKHEQKQSCARAICECDRGAAFRLGRFEKHWDKLRHRIWSIAPHLNCPNNAQCSVDHTPHTDEWKKCRGLPANTCLFMVGKRCVYHVGSTGVDHEEICCGEYEDEGRRYIERDHGGAFACCNHATGTGHLRFDADHPTYWDKNHETGLPFAHPWDGNMYNVITHCCPNGKVLSFAAEECPVE